MRSNLLEQTVADVLAESLGEAEGELFVVNPSHGTVEELVNVMGEIDAPTVRLIAAERTLKDVMGDFLVDSTAAESSGKLEPMATTIAPCTTSGSA